MTFRAVIKQLTGLLTIPIRVLIILLSVALRRRIGLSTANFCNFDNIKNLYSDF